jgi:transposase
VGCLPEAADQVVEILHQPPDRFGIARSRWRLQDLRQVVPALQHYSLPGISTLLVRLGIRHKRGRLRVHSPDPAYHAKLERITEASQAAHADPDQVVLCCADEYSLYRQPTLAGCFARQGVEPCADLSLRPNRYHRYSAALNVVTGQLTWIDGPRMSVPNLVRFLQALRAAYPTQTLFLAWDNWPVHKHHRVLAAAEQLEVTLLWLPTYAPWTNPIEKLWRWLKQTLVHHHHYADRPDVLQQQVATFLDQFDCGSEDLLHYVGLLPN